MRSGTKYTLAACSAILLLMLLDLLLLRGPPPPRRELKLADGRVIQLAGLSEGPSHSLGKPNLRSFVAGMLPGPIRKWTGPSFSSSFGFGRPGLALWLMCYDPATDTYQANWINQASILDEHGCEFFVYGMGNASDGPYRATVLNFPVYPRGASQLTCRIYDMNGQKLVDFPFHYSSAAPTTSLWTAQTLPIWKTNGALTLRLDGFAPLSKPRFQMHRNGQPEDFWAPENIYLEDSSGNSGQYLCRKLPAWKWRATFHRTPDAPFVPREIVTLTNITLPLSGQISSNAVRATIAGVAITNLTVAGPGRIELSNNVLVVSLPWRAGMSKGHGSGGSFRYTTIWRSSDKISLLLPRLPIPQNSKLIVRARRNGQIVGTASDSGATHDLLFADFSTPNPAGVVDLDFILDPGHSFDFLVPPSDVVGAAKLSP